MQFSPDALLAAAVRIRTHTYSYSQLSGVSAAVAIAADQLIHTAFGVAQSAPGAQSAGNVVAAPAPVPIAPAVPASLPPAVPQPPALPAAPAPVAAPAPADVDVARDAANPGVDSTGLPWDERIHSNPPSTGEKTGVWRRKRGVNPALEASVTHELRSRAAPAAVPQPPAPAAAPPVPVPPAAPVANAPFPALMGYVQRQKAAGTLTDDALQAACAAAGIPDGNFISLVTQPDRIPAVREMIDAYIVGYGFTPVE